VRIALQLIHAESGAHRWAERYDQKLEDVLAMPDDIVRSVVTAVENRIVLSEEEQSLRKPPQDWAAYDYVLQARQLMWSNISYLEAETPLRRAIGLDPSNAEAHALLVYPLLHKYILGDEVAPLEEALELARRAIVLNPKGSGPQFALAIVCALMPDQHSLSGLQYDRAIALNPNNTNARIGRAEWLLWGGEPEAALAALEDCGVQEQFALPFYWDLKVRILFQLRRYQETLDALGRLIRPHFWVSAYGVAALVHAGQVPQAEAKVAALIAAHPNATVARVLKAEVYRVESLRDHLVEGLRRAGMPA
jgi:adenylate cyclase